MHREKINSQIRIYICIIKQEIHREKINSQIRIYNKTRDAQGKNKQSATLALVLLP